MKQYIQAETTQMFLIARLVSLNLAKRWKHLQSYNFSLMKFWKLQILILLNMYFSPRYFFFQNPSLTFQHIKKNYENAWIVFVQ